MRVLISNLAKRFGSTTVLGDVSLEIGSQELFFLLGPSGCGKTTLLRLIAGFYQPDGGELVFGDKPMNGVPGHPARSLRSKRPRPRSPGPLAPPRLVGKLPAEWEETKAK